MANMEKTRKNRKVLRMSFTKAANELDGHIKTVPLVFSDVEIAWECLKPKWDTLIACDIEVYNSLLDDEATEDQLMGEMEQCEVYLKRFTGLKLLVGKLLSKPVDEQSVEGDTGKVDASKACTTPREIPLDVSGNIPLSTNCNVPPDEYAFQDLENLQFLNSSCIESGNYDTNIHHEDAWIDDNYDLGDISGPHVYDTDCGFTVPSSSQLLYSDALINTPSSGCRRRCHRHSCGRCFSESILYPKEIDIHSCDNNGGNTTQTKTTSNSSNKNEVFVKKIKNITSSNSSSVKGTENNHSHHHGGCCSEYMDHNCRYVQSTRMVPKVTVQPRIRYIPQVTKERILRYVPNTAINHYRGGDVVSNEDCCKTREGKGCHCQRRCKEAIICQNTKSEDQCSTSSSENLAPKRKIGCW